MKVLKMFTVALALVACGVFAWTLTLDQPKRAEATTTTAPAEATAADEPWISAAGNMWTGAVLYFGPEKMLVGTILGGSEKPVTIGGHSVKAVRVKMAEGTEEWKDRAAIAGGDWYVRKDDPALSEMAWQTYTN